MSIHIALHSSQQDISYNQYTCTKKENIFFISWKWIPSRKDLLPISEVGFFNFTKFSIYFSGFLTLRESILYAKILSFSLFTKRLQADWVVKCFSPSIDLCLTRWNSPHTQDFFTFYGRTFNRQHRCIVIIIINFFRVDEYKNLQ